jgi:recombinational DNA repair ATPase RecF
MINSFEVKSFRCFEDLTVEGLALVNVVVGESASGKTTLMEAVALGMGGNPDRNRSPAYVAGSNDGAGVAPR